MAILIPSRDFEGLAPVKPVKPPPIARARPDVTPLVPPPQPSLPPLPGQYPGEIFRGLGGALGYGLGRAGEAVGGALGTAGEAVGEYLAAPTRQTYALTPEDTARAYQTGELPPGAVWTDSGPAYPAPRLQSRGEELGQIAQHPLAQTIGVTVPAPVRGPGTILGSRGIIKLSPAKMRSDVSSELLRRVKVGEPIVEQLGGTAGQIGERIGKLSDDAVRRIYDLLFPRAAKAAKPVTETGLLPEQLGLAGERVPTFRPEGFRPEVQAEFPGGVPSVTMREGAAAQAQRQAALARGQAEFPLEVAPPAAVVKAPITAELKASPELRKFLTEIDSDIAKARQRASLLRRARGDDTEAMLEVRNLQEVRQATINLELPEDLAAQYESAFIRLDQLQAQKEMLASISSEPAYPYRRLSELASRFPEADVTAPAFRAAVKKRFGQSLDEIAAAVYPEETRGEELVLRDAQNITAALREARTIDSQIARARRFVKSVETGKILGIETPKKIVKAAEKVVQEEPAITTLAGARRVGVQARVAGKVPEVLKPAAEAAARPLVTEAKPPAGLTQADVNQWLRARKPSEVATPSSATVMGSEVPPPQESLNTLREAWAQPPKRVPTRRKLPEFWRGVKEAITDRHVGLRQLAERTGRPQLIDRIVTQPGAGNIALERYRVTLRDVLAEAGDVGLDDVNAYLHTRHALDVFAAHPQRLAVGVYKTVQEAQAALDGLVAQLGVDGPRLVKAAEVVQKRYQAELQRLVQEGFLEDSLAKELTQKYPWYNPLRYPEILEEAAAVGRFGGGAKNAASMIKRLGEKGVEAIPERPLEALFDRLAYNESRIQRNGLNREIIQSALADPQVAAEVKKVSRIVPVAEVEGKAIFRPRKGVEKGELAFWQDGKLQVYEIPAWMHNEIARPISPNEGIAKIAAINNLSRAGFVTYNPIFTVANMLSDTLQAFVNRGVLPQQTLRSVGRWLRDVSDDPVLQTYRLAGARQMRFYGKDAAQAVRETEASGGNIIHSSRTLKRAIVEAIPKFGEAGEQANRVALFERQLNKYLSGWKAMNPEEVAATPQARKAAAEAVEVTINFGRGGWLVKQLDPLILFFNAAVQGTLLPYRFLRANPNARWRLGGLLGTSAALTSYNMSYPEYMDIPEWQRRGSILVMLPSEKYDVQGRKKPNYLVIVPNTRELAAFFGTQSFIMEKLFKDSPEGVGQFLATLTPLVTPLGGIPAPPILEEMFGQAANYDFFRSRPIVPQGLQDEPKEKQFDTYTSRTAIELGKLIGQSPMRISSVISGIFGGAGQVATNASDYILQTLFPGAGSPEVRLALAHVQALPPNKREAYLGMLDADVRKDVERQSRVSEPTLPVVGAFQRRFTPGYGGEVFRTGIQNENVRREGIKAALPKDILATLDKHGLEVPVAESSVTLRGRLHRFTDEQLTRNQESLVQRLKVLVPVIIANPSYAKASERQKAELLQRVISLAKEQARLDVLREVLQGERTAPTVTPTGVPARPVATPTVQSVKPPPIRRQPMLQAPVQP